MSKISLPYDPPARDKHLTLLLKGRVFLDMESRFFLPPASVGEVIESEPSFCVCVCVCVR